MKCAHGATIGQLDDNALFYLRSRGIDEQTAKDALIFGFAKEALQKVEDKSLFLQLEGIVLDRLNRSSTLQELL